MHDTRTYVGPGPDPACGGTELSVRQENGSIASMQQTYYGSNRTVVERYTPMEPGVWQVELKLYSSRWQNDESPSPERLVRTETFRSDQSDPVENVLKEQFGFGDIEWEKEPARLMEYYHSNRKDFELEE